jgi:hypothetical protein
MIDFILYKFEVGDRVTINKPGTSYHGIDVTVVERSSLHNPNLYVVKTNGNKLLAFYEGELTQCQSYK